MYCCCDLDSAICTSQQYGISTGMGDVTSLITFQAMDGICDLVFQSYGVVRFVCTRFMETVCWRFSDFSSGIIPWLFIVRKELQHFT